MTFEGLYATYRAIFDISVLPVAERYFIYLSPLGAAIFLGIAFWEIWIRYVRLSFFLSLKYTLLELRLPRDTFKSPLAMETVLTAIHNTADGTAYGRVWTGVVRSWYSLEIVSVEGQVKFYIWTEDRRKNNLKSALYSQYPGIEVREAEDYSRDVQWDPKLWKMWASEFQFTQKENANAYPIKTYVDYGLDKDPKEEFKIDPLVHMLEWLGSLRPNEQAWFQFVCRAHIKEQKKPGHLLKKTDTWKDEANKVINEIMLRDPKTKSTVQEKTKDPFAVLNFPRLTKGEQDIISAIERKLQKLPFDVVVRGLYVAQRSVFDTPFGIGGVISSMKQYNSEHLNGFRPGGSTTMPGAFDYPWQDYKNTRRNYRSKRVLMAYRRRSAFYPPYKAKSMVLNTEELATIFHLPGAVAGTPTLERIPSKRGEAPVNLPT